MKNYGILRRVSSQLTRAQVSKAESVETWYISPVTNAEVHPKIYINLCVKWWNQKPFDSVAINEIRSSIVKLPCLRLRPPTKIKKSLQKHSDEKYLLTSETVTVYCHLMIA